MEHTDSTSTGICHVWARAWPRRPRWCKSTILSLHFGDTRQAVSGSTKGGNELKVGL